MIEQALRMGGGLQPIPAALGFMKSPARFVCAVTGRRGTKTYSGARKFANRMMRDLEWNQRAEAREIAKRDAGKPHNAALIYSRGNAKVDTAEWHKRKPRLLYWVVAETYDLLDESQVALSQVIPEELMEHTNTASRVWWLEQDIKIQFKSCKVPKRLVARGLNGLWIEEAVRLLPSAWLQFLRAALSDKDGWAIVTTTPMGYDWVHQRFVEPAEKGTPGYAFFTWETADNPYIPRQEIADAQRDMPPEYFEREYRGRFNVFEGQIYKHWHTRYEHDALPEGIQFARILGGVDWGISNPGAELIVGITQGGHIWAFDEVYQRSELVEDFWVPNGLRLQAEHQFSEWVCDPAEPDNLRRFTRAGMRAVGHRNFGSGKYDEHARSILSGIRTVASLIHRGMVHIVKPRCPNLVREIGSYRWEQTPRGDWLEKPAAHQSDHAVTALRYAISYSIKPPVMRAL
jgi:hypothetical protein